MPCGCSRRAIRQSTVTETIIAVSAFDDRRITVLQPLQRGRRRATYEFLLENHGNNLASCRLHLVDASQRRRVIRPACRGRGAGIKRPRAAQAARQAQLLPAPSAGRLRDRSHRARARARHRAGDADPAADDPGPHDRPCRTRVGRHRARDRRLVLGRAARDPRRRRPCRRRPRRRVRAHRVDDRHHHDHHAAGRGGRRSCCRAGDDRRGRLLRIAVDVGITQERSESMQVPPTRSS